MQGNKVQSRQQHSIIICRPAMPVRLYMLSALATVAVLAGPVLAAVANSQLCPSVLFLLDHG
jgi:hypothetical protein